MVPKGAPIKAIGIMDAWKRGRIIYAYLIWVVFKATTAGGLYGEYTHTSRAIIYLEDFSSRALLSNVARKIVTSLFKSRNIKIREIVRKIKASGWEITRFWNVKKIATLRKKLSRGL